MRLTFLLAGDLKFPDHAKAEDIKAVRGLIRRIINGASENLDMAAQSVPIDFIEVRSEVTLETPNDVVPLTGAADNENRIGIRR